MRYVAWGYKGELTILAISDTERRQYELISGVLTVDSVGDLRRDRPVRGNVPKTVKGAIMYDEAFNKYSIEEIELMMALCTLRA